MVKKIIKKQIKSTGTYKTLMKEKEALKNEIKSLKNENNILRNENNNLKTTLDNYLTYKKDVKEGVSKLKSQYSVLNDQYTSEREVLSKKIKNLQKENQIFRTENHTLKTDNKGLKIQINNFTKVKENLLKDRNELVESTFKTDINVFDNPTLETPLMEYVIKTRTEYEKNNEIFTLWINDNNELPELQQLSLKSMLLTGHKVTLYTYNQLESVPDGIEVADANEILDKSNIFKYKEGFNKGSYSAVSNLFRVKCLYEKGKAWFDCDILAINNINNIQSNGPTITSEYSRDGSIHPNVGFLRLNKGDNLLKECLDYIGEIKHDIIHGETGPKLMKLKMDENYRDYYDYLVNPNFIASINWYDYKDFLKPTKDVVPKLKINEIWGFHVWNAKFREDGNEHETIGNGFYYDLKKAIKTSLSKEEYEEKIGKIFNISS